MAITDARILRSLRIAESKGDKGSKQVSATQELLIISDTANPTYDSVLSDSATYANLGNTRLPQINDQATVNGVLVYVTSRELAPFDDNDRALVMTVRYDAKEIPDEEDKPNNNDPQAWKRVSIQTQQMTQPAIGYPTLGDTLDPGVGTQKTAQNSAGDPIDGLEEDVALVRLTYTNTQVLVPNFVALHSYVNKCNWDPFLAGASYTVRCVGWSGEWDQKNNTWSITVEFLYKPDTWAIKFYDVGFTEIVNNERRAILDKAGNPVSKPVPLDGLGQAAAIAGGEVNLQTRELYPYISKTFSNIFNDCGI